LTVRIYKINYYLDTDLYPFEDKKKNKVFDFTNEIKNNTIKMADIVILVDSSLSEYQTAIQHIIKKLFKDAHDYFLLDMNVISEDFLNIYLIRYDLGFSALSTCFTYKTKDLLFEELNNGSSSESSEKYINGAIKALESLTLRSDCFRLVIHFIGAEVNNIIIDEEVLVNLREKDLNYNIVKINNKNDCKIIEQLGKNLSKCEVCSLNTS